MDEDYIRHRIDQILRQKIAMGGCGEQGCDMMYATGVNVGGRRPSKGIRHCLREVMEPSGVRRCARYAPGGGVLLGGKGTREGGLKAAAHSPWVEFVRNYADEYDITYKEALQEAGPAYKQFKRTGEAEFKRPKRPKRPKRTSKTKLTARQRSRINKYYKTKVKSGPHKDSCFKYDPKGPWYLNDEYRCVRSHKAKKKR